MGLSKSNSKSFYHGKFESEKCKFYLFLKIIKEIKK